MVVTHVRILNWQLSSSWSRACSDRYSAIVFYKDASSWQLSKNTRWSTSLRLLRPSVSSWMWMAMSTPSDNIWNTTTLHEGGPPYIDPVSSIRIRQAVFFSEAKFPNDRIITLVELEENIRAHLLSIRWIHSESSDAWANDELLMWMQVRPNPHTLTTELVSNIDRGFHDCRRNESREGQG